MGNDPTLDEVKAVLKRIQQLDVPVSGVGEDTPPSEIASVHPRQALRVFDAKYAATVPVVSSSPSRGQRGGWTIYVYSALAAVMVAVLGVMFAGPMLSKRVAAPTAATPMQTPSPEANAPKAAASSQSAAPVPQSSPSQASAIGQARNLLASGDVTAARGLILNTAAAETPAGAFALAQSYDRNYLATLSNPNASADLAEAERWYRRWYDLALASGLKMDPDRLSRIVNAMK